jgi:LysR family transcriptional regulator, glycine cleavage system transcriptional activator
MLNQFPGLRSLRAFEAAARHLNFTRAASEMGVTPAAISNQIREIEEQIAVNLFTRTSRTMRLTKAGEILFEAAKEAMGTLERGLVKAHRTQASKQLRVSASPSLAAKWLVPRIDRFLNTIPGADVRIDVSALTIDFAQDDIDVAIRFGSGNYPGLRIDLLFQDQVYPVCSPMLITDAKPLNTPHDLLKHNLIHLDWEAQGQPWPNWRMWMQAAGIKDFDDRAGLHFGHTALTVQAAIDGMGVALGDSNLVADDLAKGRLIRPFDLSLQAPANFAYWLIAPEETADTPMIRAFREWCLTEARATEKSVAQS